MTTNIMREEFFKWSKTKGKRED